VFDVPTPGGGPLEFLEKLAPAKTRGIGLLYGENCIYLTSAVFDWQTDGRTEGREMAYSELCIMLSRVVIA